MTEQPHTLQVFNESGQDIPVTNDQLKSLLNTLSSHEEVQFEMVELAYVSEEEIIRVNKEFLDRDYVTDIISFRYDDDPSLQNIEGTLYCCARRIAEQAKEFNSTAENEFLRIFIHGLLHLAGYNDQNRDEKEEMTRLENKYLDLAS